jgi:hypothetical protein
VHIFISYKREEQNTASKLADALEGAGWTVWWDPMLRAGGYFDEVIEKALNEASTRCRSLDQATASSVPQLDLWPLDGCI